MRILGTWVVGDLEVKLSVQASLVWVEAFGFLEVLQPISMGSSDGSGAGICLAGLLLARLVRTYL